MHSSNGLDADGTQTCADPHDVGVPVKPHPSAFSLHVAGGTDGISVDGVQLAPWPTCGVAVIWRLQGTVSVRRRTPAEIWVHVLVAVAVPQGASEHVPAVPAKMSTVTGHVTSEPAPQVQVEHVAAGALRPEPPWNAPLVPDGHEGFELVPPVEVDGTRPTRGGRRDARLSGAAGAAIGPPLEDPLDEPLEPLDEPLLDPELLPLLEPELEPLLDPELLPLLTRARPARAAAGIPSCRRCCRSRSSTGCWIRSCPPSRRRSFRRCRRRRRRHQRVARAPAVRDQTQRHQHPDGCRPLQVSSHGFLPRP